MCVCVCVFVSVCVCTCTCVRACARLCGIGRGAYAWGEATLGQLEGRREKGPRGDSRRKSRNRVKYRATTAERLQRVKHSVETEHPAPCQRVNQAPTTVRNQCHPAGAGRIAAGLARTPGALVLLCVCPARLGPSCRQGGRSSAGQTHTRTVRDSPSLRSHSSPYPPPHPPSLPHFSLSQSRGATAPCRRRPPCTKPVTAAAQSGVWPGLAASAASLRLPLWLLHGLAAAAASRARSWPQLCTTGGDQEQGLEKLSNDNRHFASPTFKS